LFLQVSHYFKLFGSDMLREQIISSHLLPTHTLNCSILVLLQLGNW